MTITAEQAQALKAGITPGRWKAADAKGTFGILCYEDIRNDTGTSIASVWHSDDYVPMPDRKTRAGNANAIAAVPDMLDTIIAQAAEIDRLTCKRDEAPTPSDATGELVPTYGVERHKFYRKDWDLNTLLLARDGKLFTDGGEGWRYEYSHSDGTGGEYDMCFRLTDTVGDM